MAYELPRQELRDRRRDACVVNLGLTKLHDLADPRDAQLILNQTQRRLLRKEDCGLLKKYLHEHILVTEYGGFWNYGVGNMHDSWDTRYGGLGMATMH